MFLQFSFFLTFPECLWTSSHPKTIQCWENDSACHVERLHTALRVSRGDKTAEVIVWEIDNRSFDPLLRAIFRWP